MQNSITCSRDVEIRLEQEKEVHARGTLSCSVDTTGFTNGECNVVVALTFSDSTQWVARNMLPQDREDNETDVSLLTEISTMQLVRPRMAIPVLRVWVSCDDGKRLWLPLPVDGSPPRKGPG